MRPPLTLRRECRYTTRSTSTSSYASWALWQTWYVPCGDCKPSHRVHMYPYLPPGLESGQTRGQNFSSYQELHYTGCPHFSNTALTALRVAYRAWLKPPRSRFNSVYLFPAGRVLQVPEVGLHPDALPLEPRPHTVHEPAGATADRDRDCQRSRPPPLVHVVRSPSSPQGCFFLSAS